MRNGQCTLGVSLIYLASALLTLNLLAWVLYGASLRLAVPFLVLWVAGVFIAAIEPSFSRLRERD